MVSQLQSVSTVDLYYICQMVDNVTRSPGSYIRHVEDVFGDMSSIALTRKFPKWTCFHIFIEEIISSVIFEEAGKSDKHPGNYWVDALLRSNDMTSNVNSGLGQGSLDGYEYFEVLQKEDLIQHLCEKLAKQVFHVLFSNRGTLSAFGHMVDWYVSDTARTFEPEAFTQSGHLIRVSPPSWARSSVFHRDKGRCVLCKTDLTRLFSQQSEIHYDHIIPLAKGGMNCITNLQLTCSTCNLRKGGSSSSTSIEYEVWYDY